MKKETKSKLTSFLDKNYERMVSFARSRFKQVAEKDGEDIVQDVMLNLLKKTNFVSPIENLTSYAYQSLRNKIVDELRTNSRNDVSLNRYLNQNSSSEFIELVQGVEEEFEDCTNLIHDALSVLPESQRYVIVENELKGRKLKEIALELNKPLGTILARKSRGMKQLKTIIESMEDNNEDV